MLSAEGHKFSFDINVTLAGNCGTREGVDDHNVLKYNKCI